MDGTTLEGVDSLAIQEGRAACPKPRMGLPGEEWTNQSGDGWGLTALEGVDNSATQEGGAKSEQALIMGYFPRRSTCTGIAILRDGIGELIDGEGSCAYYNSTRQITGVISSTYMQEDFGSNVGSVSLERHADAMRARERGLAPGWLSFCIVANEDIEGRASCVASTDTNLEADGYKPGAARLEFVHYGWLDVCGEGAAWLDDTRRQARVPSHICWRGLCSCYAGKVNMTLEGKKKMRKTGIGWLDVFNLA